MKLHLVDGTFEMFRCYYGAPKASTADGVEVGALRGLLRTLHALIQGEATHVAVAFDHVIESFRNDLFPGYKTGEGIEPPLRSQLEAAEAAAAALGCVVWPMVEFEADDALATAARRWRDDFEQIVICTPDKDLAQCVEGARIVMRDRIRGTELDEAGVIEKFGVRPASIPDWLALVGDTADGIPGLPGWGARSSSTVLAHYHHIDAIPDDPGSWAVKVRGAARLAGVLAERRADAVLYRTLATLRADVPLAEQTPDDLRWRGVDRERLATVCAAIEYDRFLDRI